MTKASTPAQTGLTRVWIIEGRARGDHRPSYQTCMRMGGVTWGQGGATRIEQPSSKKYDEFDEVGKVKGGKERPTTSLVGLFAMDVQSEILRLVRKGCSVDVQLHMGDCTDPTVASKYKKIMIFEDVDFSNYSTDDLGALASGDRKQINETGELSARDLYEIVPMSFAERAGTLVTNEVLDVSICDSLSCGECTSESDGCQKILAITKGAGGSPGTPPDLLYTLNGGSSWFAHDIDTIATAVDPSGVACMGLYAVVICAGECSLNYTLLSELDGVTDPSWTEVTTGFVAGGCPRAVKSVGNYMFIVGNGGYIYGTADPTAGVSVLDAGQATADTLLAVDALNESFAVAVGGNSSIVKTEDGSTWSKVGGPTGVAINYNCVAVKSETEWWIGTSTGRLYYTLNGGSTWTEKSFSGSGAGVVYDIVFASASVAYLSHSTAAPRGRILRSNDGGYSWFVLPENVGSLPLSDRVNALAACPFDVNHVVGVGLADNGSDGYIVVGEGP
jgi:hypothetical protein